jgi:uncharacterized membrane protein
MATMLRPEATDRDIRRLVGIDMARCLALLGMMATHILPGFEGLEVPWPQQLAGGRAAALFAVLAGVSMSLMTGREQPVHGSERVARSSGLAFRALLIAALGLYLAVLETDVAIILTYYGLLFLLGLPFIGLGARALGVLAACWLVVLPVVSHLLRPQLPDRLPGSPTLDRLAEPLQLLTELSFTGTYPVLPWMTYLFAGMAIGRLDLRAASTAWRLLLGGVALAATAWISSHVLTSGAEAQQALRTTLDPSSATSQEALDATLVHGLFGVTPTESWWWLAVVAPHSTTSFDLAQTTGSALAVIGLCLLVSRLQPRFFAVLFGAGAMTLSLYSLHIVMLTPEVWPPIESGIYARHVIVVLVIGAVFAWFRWRGPLEFTVATLSGSVADSVRTRRSQPDRA